ncbi:No apical meristem (NAM) protein [Corchorus capsularis]|uniref:No apical meristem (NAM) protein n=1 Tax=Corchorus capsularis TaxID=210143 RepID=A0A1R3KYX6_COCAP|nr:No apical meristem (NAM) protein [Corchorus capsularis]
MEKNNSTEASSSSSAATGNEFEEFLETMPPGYRFCPTDNELVEHYLNNKIHNHPLPMNFIPQVKFYDNDPSQLIANDKPLGETEWYFFSSRDRKYPNGSRPSRSTPNGYWKPTGVDKPIPAGSPNPLGKKTTLDFYQGRHGDKNDSVRTDWKMHEYVLKDSANNSQPGNCMTLNNFVLCKLYKNKYKTDKNYRDDDDQEGNNNIAAIEQQPLMSINYISSSSLTEMPLPQAQGTTVCNNISSSVTASQINKEEASSSSLMLVDDQRINDHINNGDQFEDKAAVIQPNDDDDYLTYINALDPITIIKDINSDDLCWDWDFLEDDGSAAPKDPTSAKGL